MIISARQINSYINNTYHEDNPFPSNTQIPENADPTKYDGLPNTEFCPNCKKPVLIGNPKNKDNTNPNNCPHCNGRLSIGPRDKAWGNIAQNPATLDVGMGSNTNNAAGGVEYHPGANSNQDTFSSNLGRGDGSYAR